jgi:hypothetical protein
VNQPLGVVSEHGRATQASLHATPRLWKYDARRRSPEPLSHCWNVGTDGDRVVLPTFLLELL